MASHNAGSTQQKREGMHEEDEEILRLRLGASQGMLVGARIHVFFPPFSSYYYYYYCYFVLVLFVEIYFCSMALILLFIVAVLRHFLLPKSGRGRRSERC